MLCNCSQSWWRHQMETYSALLAICAGNSPVTGEFPAQRPVTWSFDVFFDLHPNKPLSKQWWGWWFEMPWRPLWRHSNGSSKSGTWGLDKSFPINTASRTCLEVSAPLVSVSELAGCIDCQSHTPVSQLSGSYNTDPWPRFMSVIMWANT